MPTRDAAGRRWLAAALLAIVAWGAAPARATELETAPEPPDAYDPFAGMDEDGRIPGVVRPAALEHPERWRYIPEGRLKPGHFFQRFAVSSFAVPFVFNDGDVGTGLGLAVTDIDFRQQRRREFAGAFVSYTTEGQQNYSFVWRRWAHHREVPEGGVLLEERSFMRLSGGFSKTLTRRFYGFGPKSRESRETSYTDRLIDLDFGVQRALPGPGSDFLVDLGVSGELHEITSGKVSGKPFTKDAFPSVVGGTHSRVGWLQTGIAWDTRDSQRTPYTGFELRARMDAALLQRGGDVGALYTLRGSRTFRLPGLFHDGGDPQEENPPTDTLALLLENQWMAGELPFFSLPALGGSTRHRGFIEGRFRDRTSWIGVAEYRFWIVPRGFRIPFTRSVRIERIGAALFYETGAVARYWTRLFRSRLSHSYGVSLRIMLERLAPFRVDFGFSEDGMNVTARFGLSF